MKTLKIIIVFILVIFLLLFFGNKFAPGSYPYREEYELNVPESTLIRAIQDFKKANSQYIVPEEVQLTDGRNSESGQDFWYHIYFYYPKENQIIYTWLRPAEKGKTTFALISINQGRRLGKWKDINKDFNWSENRSEKKKFEERILNKIKKKL